MSENNIKREVPTLSHELPVHVQNTTQRITNIGTSVVILSTSICHQRGTRLSIKRLSAPGGREGEGEREGGREREVGGKMSLVVDALTYQVSVHNAYPKHTL